MTGEVAVWEWRAFADRFELGGLIEADAPEEVRTDVYVAGPGMGPTRGLKLRGRGELELKLRGEVEGSGIEAWTKPFVCDLEVPPWRARELARLAAPGGPVPVRPLRDGPGLVRWADDVGLGPARLIVVEKRLRGALLEGGVRLEHGAVRIDGRALETVCLVAGTPAAVAGARAALGLPPGSRACGWPELLAT